MIKVFFFFFILNTSYAWIDPENYNSAIIDIEKKSSPIKLDEVLKNLKPTLDKAVVKRILTDSDKRIKEEFKITKFYQESVNFWFSIYTQYASTKVVIHDKKRLGIIYNILDFDNIKNSTLNKYTQSNLQTKLTGEYTKKLKKILKQLRSADFKKLNHFQQDIVNIITKAGSTIPTNKEKRKKFFDSLIDNLRTQTGQRDMIGAGVKRFLPYRSFLEKQAKNFNLPWEVIAISFLESSFNYKALSKVDAAGIWQFMRYTGNLIFPRSGPRIDYRKNPVISSIGAFHLLKQNRQILKRWDLAVTAYNSGTKNIITARRKYKKNISLEFLLKNYKHPSFGFASKNFYSEFLALVHVLAYKKEIFPQAHQKDYKKFNYPHIYVSKCPVKPSRFIRLLKKSSPSTKELNTHLKYLKRVYPRGTLLVSDLELSKRKYYKLTQRELKKNFPKNYSKLIRRKKCGN